MDEFEAHADAAISSSAARLIHRIQAGESDEYFGAVHKEEGF
jgi:hypothetical protein